MVTIILLVISNIFMTTAWYWHLKYRHKPLLVVIFLSWSIAFFEYMFQVPANRIGYATFNAFQLKTIQEVISLIIFSGFSIVYLREKLRWNYIAGFLLIILAILVIFLL